MTPTDPVALVTGGAGGIGTALCRHLAARGYRVVAVDIDPAGADSFQADVSDPDQNRAMVAHAVSRYGRLDLVVLNAGLNPGQEPGDPLGVESYRGAVRVNVDGVVFGIDAAAPALSRQGGAILVMASLAALGPEQANPVYALTKCAVLGYVRAMAAPLAQRGVSINALCPGFADTAFLGLGRRLLRKQGFPLLAPEEVAGALVSVLDGGGTGEAWALVAGRPPTRFAFPAIPTTLMPDGSEATVRPLLRQKH